MIEELKLVNRNTEEDAVNQTPFNGSSDIDFDNSGNMIRCQNDEGLEQNLLKAVITSVQQNGYGTDMFALLGKKNIELVRSKLMYEIISSLNILKQNQLSYLNKQNTYNKKNIVANLFNIKSNKTAKTNLTVSLKVQSLDSKLKNESNLSQINFIVNENINNTYGGFGEDYGEFYG